MGRGWKGRGWQQAEVPSADDAAAWFGGRLPDGWFTGDPELTVDREEILIVGELPALTGDYADDAARAAAADGRISRFREETRDERIEIARQAEHRYQRKVAWGAKLGGTTVHFTTLSVPVMTRLRQPERLVLDTLVDAGCRAVAVRGAGLGGAAGRRARGRVAVRTARSDDQGRRPAVEGARFGLSCGISSAAAGWRQPAVSEEPWTSLLCPRKWTRTR